MHGNQMAKFADDTSYIIISAVNASSRHQAELSNDVGEAWARAKNLKVNPAKYPEVVFFDKRRKTRVEKRLTLNMISLRLLTAPKIKLIGKLLLLGLKSGTTFYIEICTTSKSGTTLAVSAE